MNRRHFLRNTAAGIVGAGIMTRAPVMKAEEMPPNEPLKIKAHRKLGRTGFMASDIGSGGNPAPAVLRAVLEAGVNYIDSSESYGRGQSERTIGQVIKDFDRKSIFITTKLHLRENQTRESILESARKSLERLQTDYIDCMMIHGCPDTKTVKYEPFHAAMKQLKNEGRIRFVGLSNHGASGEEKEDMEKVLLTAIADGRFDVMLLVYNFIQREMGERILKAAAEKNIGCTSMKNKPVERYFIEKKQMEERAKASGGELSERARQRVEIFKKVADQAESFIKKHNLNNPHEIRDAALRFVLNNPHLTSAVIHFRSFDDVDPHIRLSGSALSDKDKKTLALYREGCGSFYCRHACGLCEPHCPHGVPVNTIMRYNHYFESQGLEKHAMEEYTALSTAKADRCERCPGYCEPACPYNVHIHAQLIMAHYNLTMA